MDVYWLLEKNDWPAILKLIDAGALEPNQKIVVQMIAYQHAMYLLPVAVQRKEHAVIRALLAKGANPNQRYELETPLIIACDNRDHEAIELLLGARANVDIAAPPADGEEGQTPLMIAAEDFDLWTVERLLRAGAKPSRTTPRRKHSAAWFVTIADDPRKFPERAAVIRALVSAGCKLAGNELHWPVYHRDAELVGLLLELGCPVNEIVSHGDSHGPRKGETPLTLAVEGSVVDLAVRVVGAKSLSERKRDIVAGLLSAGADPNRANDKGQTPLLLAAMGYERMRVMESEIGSELEKVRLLLDAGADPDFCPPESKAGSALDFVRKENVQVLVDLFGHSSG